MNLYELGTQDALIKLGFTKTADGLFGPSSVERAGMLAAPADDRESGYLIGAEEEAKENWPTARWMAGGALAGGALGYGAGKLMHLSDHNASVPALLGVNLGGFGAGIGRSMYGTEAAKARTIARMQELQNSGG